MFGIGQTELIIILVVVLIIFGPKNLPKLAKSLGRSVRELKDGLTGVGDDIKESMKDPSENPYKRDYSADEYRHSGDEGVTEAQPVEHIDPQAHKGA